MTFFSPRRFGMLWGVLFCLMATAVHAVPVEVLFRVRGEPPAEPFTVSLMASAVAEGPEARPRTVEVRSTAAARLDLAAGTAWRLGVEAAGYWSGPEIVWPTSGTATATLTLHPTGYLGGTLAVPRHEELPAEIQVRFQSASGAAEEIPEAILSCPVRERRWSCEIPAGRLDLRLRARGFVSHFRWGVEIKAGRLLEVGHLALERGASLVGRVAAAEGALSPEECAVELAPASAGVQESPADEERLRRLLLSARVDERGFFHFRNIPPGSYTVLARHPGFAPARLTPVTVLQDAETEIREPLVLERPLPLEVWIDPPLDGLDRPWHLQIMQLTDIPGGAEAVAAGAADVGGVFLAREGLSPGSYLIRVADVEGSRLASEMVELSPGQSRFDLRLSLVWVEGTVYLGEEPLVAELWFGGRSGAQRTLMPSDEEGAFFGYLPREGTWDVYVQAEHPPVRRTLKKVEVRHRSRRRAARVDLRLPDTKIHGTVVDGDDRPVSAALVRLFEMATAETTGLRSDAEGGFEFRGVGEGSATVRAELGDLASEPLLMEVDERREPAPIELVLRRLRRLTGRVVSGAASVPGAAVLVFPYSARDGTFLSGDHRYTTDAGGTFHFTVPEVTGILDLVVLAPGYSLKVLTPREPEEASPLLIEVEPGGGALLFETPEPIAWDDPRSPKPVLFVDGVPLHAHALRQWALVNGVPAASAGQFLVPRLPPGRHLACRVALTEADLLHRLAPPSNRCTEVFVTPGGTQTVRLPGE